MDESGLGHPQDGRHPTASASFFCCGGDEAGKAWGEWCNALAMSFVVICGALVCLNVSVAGVVFFCVFGEHVLLLQIC